MKKFKELIKELLDNITNSLYELKYELYFYISRRTLLENKKEFFQILRDESREMYPIDYNHMSSEDVLLQLTFRRRYVREGKAFYNRGHMFLVIYDTIIAAMVASIYIGLMILCGLIETI